MRCTRSTRTRLGPGPREMTIRNRAALYVFTALLGLLIGGDVLLGFAGLGDWRLPGGVSLSLVAALLGAVYIVYGALDALFHGRLGADFALAQACIAALFWGSRSSRPRSSSSPWSARSSRPSPSHGPSGRCASRRSDPAHGAGATRRRGG